MIRQPNREDHGFARVESQSCLAQHSFGANAQRNGSRSKVLTLTLERIQFNVPSHPKTTQSDTYSKFTGN